MPTEFFVASNLTPGMLVRLERIRRGWRQTDLAKEARVTQAEVSALERGCYVVPVVQQRILLTLGLDVKNG